MKWDGDPYQAIKQTIFDVIRNEIPEPLAYKITIRQLTDAIDNMINELVKDK